MPVRLPRFSNAWRRSCRYDSSAVVKLSSSASSSDWLATSLETLPKAASTDMPDCTQMSSMSSASGNAILIDCWRFWIRFSMKMLGA